MSLNEACRAPNSGDSGIVAFPRLGNQLLQTISRNVTLLTVILLTVTVFSQHS